MSIRVSKRKYTLTVEMGEQTQGDLERLAKFLKRSKADCVRVLIEERAKAIDAGVSGGVLEEVSK